MPGVHGVITSDPKRLYWSLLHSPSDMIEDRLRDVVITLAYIAMKQAERIDELERRNDT